MDYRKGLLVPKLVSRFIKVKPGRWMLISGLAVVVFVLLMALLSQVVSPYNPTMSSGEPFESPSLSHPMGTNKLGQDVLSRIVWGSRIVLYVVFLATVISMSIGIPLGLISGYYGGKIDRALSMVMDSIYAFPALIMAIVIAVILGPSPMNTAIAISFVYVPTYFRMVRGETLSLKGQLFVEAARAMGASSSTMMLEYILPNLAHTILVVFTLSVADAILTEAGLSFLGLSVTPPTPDWGYDLRIGQPFMLDGYWWLVFFPGMMVTILATGFALIGEALSERASIAGAR